MESLNEERIENNEQPISYLYRNINGLGLLYMCKLTEFRSEIQAKRFGRLFKLWSAMQYMRQLPMDMKEEGVNLYLGFAEIETEIKEHHIKRGFLECLNYEDLKKWFKDNHEC